MTKCNLLKLSFVWNFHDKILYRIRSLTFLVQQNKDCVIKSRDMFCIFLLINNSVTTGLSFLLSNQESYYQVLPMFFVFYLDYVHLFVNIIRIIQVFKKCFWIVKML